MATLSRKSDGRYFIDYRFEGVRKRESLGTTNPKEARIRFQVRQAELESGQGYSRQPLAAFFDMYLEFAAKNKGARTVHNDRAIIKRVKPFLKVTYVDQVTQKQADNCIASIAAEIKTGKITAHGVNWILRGIRTIFTAAVRWNYCNANPFAKVAKVKAYLPEPNPLTQTEIGNFFKACQKHHSELHDYFLVSLMSGMRRKEQTSLTWENCDLGAGLIRLIGKGGKPRVVPMLGPVQGILTNLKASGLVKPFPVNPERITEAFNHICEKAEINGHKQHDLRKTFASFLAEMNVSDYFIRRMLGWSSSVVPSAHYINYDPKTFGSIGSKMVSRITATPVPTLERSSDA